MFLVGLGLAGSAFGSISGVHVSLHLTPRASMLAIQSARCVCVCVCVCVCECSCHVEMHPFQGVSILAKRIMFTFDCIRTSDHPWQLRPYSAHSPSIYVGRDNYVHVGLHPSCRAFTLANILTFIIAEEFGEATFSFCCGVFN